MLVFIWAGHSYAPDGSQIRTLLLNEFAKLLQSPLDRAPDAVRSLGRIGFVETGSSSRALSTKESRSNTCRWVDMFGLLVAELRQQPIDNQIAVNLVFVNRDVQILGPAMDLDLLVAIREVTTVSSVFSGTKTEVGVLQICGFPLRHACRVVEQGENFIGAQAE